MQHQCIHIIIGTIHYTSYISTCINGILELHLLYHLDNQTVLVSMNPLLLTRCQAPDHGSLFKCSTFMILCNFHSFLLHACCIYHSSANSLSSSSHVLASATNTHAPSFLASTSIEHSPDLSCSYPTSQFRVPQH